MGTLSIGRPSLTQEDGRTILSYEIRAEKDGEQSKGERLWFSFDERYRSAVSYEVCDGVALILLYYALRGNYDIESEVPMSERLFYTLSHQFIPQMVMMNPKAHPVKLRMETANPEWRPGGVATAMSCGIDSLTTYYEYTGKAVPPDYHLNYLTFYEQGAHHGGGGRSWEEQDRIYQAQLERVKSFSREVGMELIDVRSNLDAFLNKLLWHQYYEHTHTYKNVGITLLLQKLIHVYYYTAVYNVDQLSFSLEADSAHYEKWMLPNLATESTSFYSVNSTMTRIEKIQFLSGKPETYRNVLVCYRDGINCGTCIKCWRTMLEMETCGVLDLYRESFDVDAFRKREEAYITEMISRTHKEPVMQQIYEYMKRNGFPVPLHCRIRGNIRRIHRLLRS